MPPESPQQFRSGTEIAPDLAVRSRRHGRRTTEPEEDGLEMPWYVRAIRRRWLIVVAATVAGGALFFGLAGRRPLMYEGVTTLLVLPPSQPGSAQMNTATFRAIVENATLAARIIEELKLHESTLGLTPQAFVEDALAVEEVRGTNIVKVKVTLRDPQLSADASRRLAEEAILLNREISQQEGASTQEQLKNHVSDARDRLQLAEQALLSYQQRAQLELVKEDAEAILKERRDLLRLIVDIEAERARLAAAEQEIKRQTPLLTVNRAPAAEEALRRIAPVANGGVNPDQLDLTNPLVNPVYQTLDFQIATSRTRIAALEKERDQLVTVRKLGGSELAQLNELYRRQMEQARLQANLDLARRVYGDVALRYEQSRTLAVGNTGQLQIVDSALPRERPLSRKRLQNAALGSAIGFVSAVLLIVLWDGRRRNGLEPQAG
jgi:uncharacterized protein involved in exopolysaccharide biosynthesis